MMEIPVSHFFRIHFCGHCPNAHLLFFDRRYQPLAQATMSAAQAEQVAREIRKRDPNFTTTVAERE